MNIFEVIERERPKYQTVLECRYITKETFDAALDRITEAAKELQAQVPKMVIPVNVLKGHMVNEYPVLSWTCPVCGQTKHKMAGELHEVVIGDPACGSCGAKLDWSKEGS